MTDASATVQDGSIKSPGLLDRERIVAKPGFNRWLVPPAALCIHLCIGMAYGFSVFWKPLEGALTSDGWIAGPRELLGWRDDVCREGSGNSARALCDGLQLEPVRSRLDVHVLLRDARPFGCYVGWLARARGSAQGGRRFRDMLVRRPLDLGPRRTCPPAMADVARLGDHRWHRARTGLHLARLDPHQVVPGPARHGDRHGHHGLRRRRHDRLAARDPAHEFFQDADRSAASGRRSSRWPRSTSCSC